jgi:hypothetical protein
MKASRGILVLVVMFCLTFACNKNTDPPAPTHISLRVTDADHPVIGIDGSDNIFAVWSASTNSTPNANSYASRYSLNGWATPVFIGDTDLGMITLLRLAVSPNGSAFAVWYKETGNIYVSRYVPGNGWGSPEALGGPLTVLDLQAVADAHGNAIVVWVEPGIPYYRLYARRYMPGIGWDATQTIDDNTGRCDLPRLAADNAGNATAIWQSNDGISTRVYANRFTAGSTWGTPALISNGTGTAAFAPEIAVNKNGTAMAVWYEDNNGTDNAYARRFVPGTGWDAIQSIETGTSNAYAVRVAIDDSGAAISLWRQPDLYYSRYMPGTGWSTAQTIATGFLDNPAVAMNGQGQAVAVWNQWDLTSAHPGDSLVYAKKFIPSAGWGTTSNLVSELGSANVPTGVIDSLGHATVIWSQTIAAENGGSTTAVFTNNF